VFVIAPCKFCSSCTFWIWNFLHMEEEWGQWKSICSRDSSVLQPYRQVAESTTPFVASLSLVLRRLCRASQAKILLFLGANEVRVVATAEGQGRVPDYLSDGHDDGKLYPANGWSGRAQAPPLWLARRAPLPVAAMADHVSSRLKMIMRTLWSY
jgi:hypothetical protein